jgi:hypothetical protein
MIVILATHKNSRKKKKKNNGQGSFLENSKKTLSHFKERSFEIAKILGGFGQISRF